jgi:hypothetical protein
MLHCAILGDVVFVILWQLKSEITEGAQAFFGFDSRIEFLDPKRRRFNRFHVRRRERTSCGHAVDTVKTSFKSVVGFMALDTL